MTFNLTIKSSGESNNNSGRIGVDAKKERLRALKQASSEAEGKNSAAVIKWINPQDCPDRNIIIFDDSASMGYEERQNAKKGIVEYLRNCVPNQTSVGVEFMNTRPRIELRSDLIALGTEITGKDLSSGSTPFFTTIKTALNSSDKPTRLIVFTDGSPSDRLEAEDGEEAAMRGFYSWNSQSTWTTSADIIISIAKGIAQHDNRGVIDDRCIPIDTVFFGSAGSVTEMNLLKYLSNATGGFFLHFDPSKVNFAKAFKYLAPINRLMLTSPAFRADVESGKRS